MSTALAELAAIADDIAAVLPQHLQAWHDARDAAADASHPPEVRAIYRAAARAHRSIIGSLRADLACCQQGVNPYETV